MLETLDWFFIVFLMLVLGCVYSQPFILGGLQCIKLK